MKTATFLDFDDSFTFNIIQELTEIGLKVTTLHWLDFEELPESDLLVVGPGPGHPDDYQRIFPLIEKWIKEKKPLFGVCLGHQIFWRIQGEEILQSREPLHGQKVKLTLNEDWQEWLKLPHEVWVQRYNSLSVMGRGAILHPDYKSFILDEEVIMTRGDRVLTYQFHPESMGTDYRKSFFLPVLRELV